MRRHRGASRARLLPVPRGATGAVLTAIVLTATLTGCDSSEDPEPGTEPLAAVTLPDDACDRILDEVKQADLPDLDLMSDEVVNGPEESTVTCAYSGGGTTFDVVLTSYASPNDAGLDGVLTDRSDQECNTLEAGGATVTRTRFGCESDVTTSVDAGRRIGAGTRVTREQAFQAVARLTLSLDTGAASTPDATTIATTQATLSAVAFRLDGLDLVD